MPPSHFWHWANESSMSWDAWLMPLTIFYHCSNEFLQSRYCNIMRNISVIVLKLIQRILLGFLRSVPFYSMNHAFIPTLWLSERILFRISSANSMNRASIRLLSLIEQILLEFVWSAALQRHYSWLRLTSKSDQTDPFTNPTVSCLVISRVVPPFLFCHWSNGAI